MGSRTAQDDLINLFDFRGGVNDADSPLALLENQVREAKNVDFREGLLACKRKGAIAIDLSGSVFARNSPRLLSTSTGGTAGGTTVNVTVPAVTDTDGTGNTHHVLVVKVNSKTAAVTVITFNAVAMTAQASGSNGAAGSAGIWRASTPLLAGGTVAMTFAAATNASVIVERWGQVDVASSFGSNPSATGTSATPALEFASDPTFGISDLVICGAATIVAVNAVFRTQIAIVATGTSRLAASYWPAGNLPTVRFAWTLSASVDWLMLGVILKGRLSSIALSDLFIVSLIRHQAGNELSNDELWAMDNDGRLDRRVAGTWQGGVPYGNSSVGFFPRRVVGASLHGKLFLAGATNANRATVWDGTVLRYAGFGQPAVPGVADTAVGGTYTGTRYFRFRYTEQVAGVTVRRSEPTTTVVFVPNGAFNGAIITKPAAGGYASGEQETHWEIEASVDNALFYRITTLPVGTTTYTDTVAYAIGYATGGVSTLSETIGEYLPPFACRFVTVDDDRMLFADNSQFSAVNGSRVQWTPVRGDEGVGNDERIPIAVRHFRDLDGLNGGGLTNMLGGINGAVFLSKSARVYTMTRTGIENNAYDLHTETETRGMILDSMIGGVDATGAACVYGLDANVGLIRVGGREGLADLMYYRRTVWATVDKTPSFLPTRIVFFAKYWFVIVWPVIGQGSGGPSTAMVYDVRTRGWTDYTGPSNQVAGAVMFPDTTTLELMPFVGISSLLTASFAELDTGVTDFGTRYRGYIVSRPYHRGNLYSKFAALGAVLHAKAATGVTIGLALIRNFGLSVQRRTKSIAPQFTETHVYAGIDDATIAECNALQCELGDPSTFTGAQLDQQWVLDALSVRVSKADDTGGKP